MIPFEELSMALDRYKRRKAGEQVPGAPAQAPKGQAPHEPTSDFNIDEVEEA